MFYVSDDPRMPTIKGLKRRGFTANAINKFCEKAGLSLAVSSTNIQYDVLEDCLRQDLEVNAKRVMAVMNPLKVNITNLKDDDRIVANILDFPNLGDKSSTHQIKVNNTIYIEKEDFRIEDSKNYFRLAPNKIVRLKYFGLIKCIDYDVDENKIPIQVNVELLDNLYNPDKRIKGTINWISSCDFVNVQVRKYDSLFPNVFDKDIVWKLQLNRNSKTTLNILCDSSISNSKPFDNYQFERIGYFCVDPDSDKQIIMNMSVELKSNKNK